MAKFLWKGMISQPLSRWPKQHEESVGQCSAGSKDYIFTQEQWKMENDVPTFPSNRNLLTRRIKHVINMKQ
jgi:hypothetical protein